MMNHAQEYQRNACEKWEHILWDKQTCLGIKDLRQYTRPYSNMPNSYEVCFVHNYGEYGMAILIWQVPYTVNRSICWLVRENCKILNGALTGVFLVYIMCNYQVMVPYLKGFHLSLVKWYSKYATEGWKVKYWPEKEAQTWDQSYEDKVPSCGLTTTVPRLMMDLSTLNGEFYKTIDVNSQWKYGEKVIHVLVMH